MPRGLLHSQFEALEEPGLDEKPITVSIEPPPREVVLRILSILGTEEAGGPSADLDSWRITIGNVGNG